MLVETVRASLAWQPAAPQVSAATRKSPGFTNFTYSADSRSHFANASGDLAARSRKMASRGSLCAFCFAATYSGEFAHVTAETLARYFPPCHSVTQSVSLSPY